MLAECFRILAPGGKIRIATPDLAFLIDLYNDKKSSLQQEYVNWAIGKFVPDAISNHETFVINNYLRNWGHQFIYDRNVLAKLLETIGFSDITSCDISESEHETFQRLETEWRIPDGFLKLETFVLEATKPVTT